MNRPYLKKACEEVDASVFSSDVLFDDNDRSELKQYAERWLSAIVEHEGETAEDTPLKLVATTEKSTPANQGLNNTNRCRAWLSKTGNVC